MHELAICQALLRQVLDMARSRKARGVGQVVLRIGPLGGVEPELLRAAFPLVAAGTICERAMLHIEAAPVQVRCRMCDRVSDVQPNRLLCAGCGAWRVELIRGDEMLLVRVELLDAPADANKELAHV